MEELLQETIPERLWTTARGESLFALFVVFSFVCLNDCRQTGNIGDVTDPRQVVSVQPAEDHGGILFTPSAPGLQEAFVVVTLVSVRLLSTILFRRLEMRLKMAAAPVGSSRCGCLKGFLGRTD